MILIMLGLTEYSHQRKLLPKTAAPGLATVGFVMSTPIYSNICMFNVRVFKKEITF